MFLQLRVHYINLRTNVITFRTNDIVYNSCPEWIHWFIWSTMIQVISDHWSWSESSQRNAHPMLCRAFVVPYFGYFFFIFGVKKSFLMIILLSSTKLRILLTTGLIFLTGFSLIPDLKELTLYKLLRGCKRQ